jgi:hypothetical protein
LGGQRGIALPAFLRAPELAASPALRANDGRCELCGRNKHQLPPGEYLTVDHIQIRKARPDLALEITNLAVLCSAETLERATGTLTTGVIPPIRTGSAREWWPGIPGAGSCGRPRGLYNRAARGALLCTRDSA